MKEPLLFSNKLYLYIAIWELSYRMFGSNVQHGLVYAPQQPKYDHKK